MDPRRRRLLFRANHRGTHETDLLVGGFVSEIIAACDSEELDRLEEVLELPDTDLFDWLTGREAVPEALASPMLARMVAWAGSRTGFAGSRTGPGCG